MVVLLRRRGANKVEARGEGVALAVITKWFQTRIYATANRCRADGHGKLNEVEKDKLNKEFKDKFGEGYSMKAFSRANIREEFQKIAREQDKKPKTNFDHYVGSAADDVQDVVQDDWFCGPLVEGTGWTPTVARHQSSQAGGNSL
eukprot:COSAG02_NODE_3634_length_6446_cov_3.541201_1_plen_145_part_00